MSRVIAPIISSSNSHHYDNQFDGEVPAFVFVISIVFLFLSLLVFAICILFMLVFAICICICHHDKQRDGGSVGSGKF